MIKARIEGKIIIRNVPESIVNGSRTGFVCVRVVNPTFGIMAVMTRLRGLQRLPLNWVTEW